MHTIDMFIQQRTLIGRAVSRLTDEQWLAIPDGFDNNIAWNIGHINTVQQSLCYRLSGLPTYSNKEQAKMYLPGTNPAGWAATPDIAQLKQQTTEFATLMQQDIAAGKFQTYTPYTTSTGIEISSLEEAIVFTGFHDGLHFGTILSLMNFL